MSGDDDIERLLAEIDGSLAGAPAKPAAGAPGASVARTSSTSGDAAPRGRGAAALRTGGIAAAVSGVGVFGATFFLQWLPLIDNPVSSGLGAAVGAFATGAVLGFRRR